MYLVTPYATLAAGIFIVLALTLTLYRRRNSALRERRIRRMMLSCGMDEHTVANPDQNLNIDMDRVRTRCRYCPVTYLCDRWLDGEALATNNFCPNAWVFRREAGSGR